MSGYGLTYRSTMCNSEIYTSKCVTIIIYFFETIGRQASAKAQEAVDHLTSFPSGREKIS